FDPRSLTQQITPHRRCTRLVFYLPFSLTKVVKKIYSIDEFGLTFLPNPKLPLICQSQGE
ncbi:MAG: hypothetical protein ACE14Q_03210, partial [Acidobacteriota bacterium]